MHERIQRWTTLLAPALLGAAVSLGAGCGGASGEKGPSEAWSAGEAEAAPPGSGENTRESQLSLYDHALRGSEFSLVPPDPPASDPGDGAIVVDGATPRTNLGPTYDVTAEEPETRPGAEVHATTARPAPEPGAVRPAVTESLDERVERLVGELAGQLRLDSDRQAFLLPGYLKVGVLDAIAPGTLASHYIGVDDGSGATALSEPEHELVVAWRDLHGAMWENVASGDVEQLAEIVGEHAERIDALRALRIVDARLCTRVEGFGVFKELPTYGADGDGRGGAYKLLTGRRHRLIVYLELDHFTHEPATREGVSGYRVELGQSLSLHHLGKDSDLVAWRMDEQKISDFSRRKRRDFFVVQIIELPEVLSVDRYNLKVRVLDEHSGAEAETIIRLDMVADASAFVEE